MQDLSRGMPCHVGGIRGMESAQAQGGARDGGESMRVEVNIRAKNAVGPAFVNSCTGQLLANDTHIVLLRHNPTFAVAPNLCHST